jgi:hypothetical protein
MEVAVEEETIFLMEILYKLFYRENHGLLLKVRILIVSVEVLVEYVHTVVAVGNSIRIYHRDQHEHEVLPEQLSSDVISKN